MPAEADQWCCITPNYGMESSMDFSFAKIVLVLFCGLDQKGISCSSQKQLLLGFDNFIKFGSRCVDNKFCSMLFREKEALCACFI